MPVYEYACGKCGHEFEAEQRITEDPLKTCPKCRSRKLKRLISQTSFVLKGGGWYADLYASKSAKDGAADKTDAAAVKSESKGEAAPAASAGGSEPAGGEPKPKPKGEGKRGKSKAKKAAA